MQTIDQYREEFENFLDQSVRTEEPESLYDPIVYILGLGGKRIRPVLVLMAAEIFGAGYKKALPAALAIEVFHNFSLIHDDIMDDAPLRRGEKTVHELWDINTGILSGDAMLIRAYQLFEKYEGDVFRDLAMLFSRTAIQVCEGQQYDIDFASREEVTVEEYLKMIEFKTAVLVGASLKMGAIVAETSAENQQKIYEFGRLLGIAFQLQDDYLDVFGDPKSFGKQLGGDIIENKKTFLYLAALGALNPAEGIQLEHLYSINPSDAASKVETVKGLFETSGAAEMTRREIESYTEKAFTALEALHIDQEKKRLLYEFGHDLMNRNV